MARKDMPEYRAWKSMKSRCYSPCNASNGGYQRKGIQVCDKWRHDFDAFLADMGSMPEPGYTLERIDNNGDYCPENCKWLPRSEQSRNRSEFHKHFTLNGETRMLKDWARHFGIKYTTLYQRIYRNGLPFEQAIESDPYGRLIEINGAAMILKDWCARFGIKYSTIVDRVYRGRDAREELIKEINTSTNSGENAA
jgi:hypothetical protein